MIGDYEFWYELTLFISGQRICIVYDGFVYDCPEIEQVIFGEYVVEDGLCL